MEARCGSCDKLFRVSDDKITGTGIKFACTRCGEYVKITKEDFERYTLSWSAVSVLDMFEPKPSTARAPLSPEAGEPVVGETAPSTPSAMTFDFSAPSTDGEALEEPAPSFAEPDHFAAPAPAAESAVEPQPEPVITPEPATAPPTQPERPRKEAARPVAQPAAERAEKEPMPSSKPSHSGRMILVLFVMLIIGGLAAYGVFVYLQSSPQKGREAAHEMTSIKGLQIVNPAGAMVENGDLLVTGVLENATEKEITAWYVVVEVYDAQGAVLTRMRLLNGKQIYSRLDFDILAKRGMNVQELKAKYLQEKGVVIPPKGAVNFELRSVQPPTGIANFNALVLPFDPVQLYKEIAGEIK